MSYRPSTDADLSGDPRWRDYNDRMEAAYIDTELARREAGEVTPTMQLTACEELIISNTRKNPNYCPYCLPCPGLVRMVKVEPFYWRCRCGAECDLRKYVSDPTPALTDSQIASKMAEPTPWPTVQAFMDGPDRGKP